MSGFNFGAASSSSGSSPSLFGTSSAAPASGTNTASIFGGANTGAGSGSGSGSLGFNFGAPSQNAASSGAETSKPLFGSTSNNTGNNGLFGKPATSAPLPTFSFGAKAEAEKPNTSAPAASPFSGFGTPDKSSAPTTSAPSLFGSTTPAAGNNSTNIFGGLSTTPAGPPPTSVGFGASTGAANMFGQNKPGQDAAKPAATPFSFGKPAENNTTKEPASTGLFGGAQPATSSSTTGLFAPKPATSGGFSFGTSVKPADKPADSANTTSTPSAGFSFGQPAKPADKPSEGAAAPPAFSGFGFGAPKPADKPAEPSTTPAPAGQKSLFSFGPPSAPSPATTTSSATATTATAPTTSSSTPSLFGAAPPSSKPTPPLFGSALTAPAQGTTPFFGKPVASSSSDPASTPAFSFPAATSKPATTSTTTPSSGTPKPLFGAAPDTTSKQGNAPGLFGQPATSSNTPGTTAPTAASGAATSTAAAPFSFGGATSTSGAQANGAPSESKFATSTVGPVPPAQSRLRNKTMDEILTRWATDLTRYQKEFKTHAETVAKWDQMIVDTSSKIDKLYVKTRTCEKQTLSVEMQLAAVENQQAELESWLDKYERDVDEMLAKEGTTSGELGGPDQEREKTYKLAEKLGERLDDMGRDLESMVEEVNAANASLGKNGKADEPITQIVKILNSHLSQLQAIDQGTATLQAKVVAAQKASNGMGYLGGTANGDGRAAVEDFYRSYMGRR